MADAPSNLLIIMSDEHSRKILGCYGNDIVQTPHLDRLAARGTVFERAYTPCPICVPARASFATGQYGHATRHWNNATPYIGNEASWGHFLQRAGHSVGSIGKLHYRDADDDTGFDFQQMPMHLVGGVGDVLGCVRDPLPVRWKNRALAEGAGRGETSYTAYDRDITSATVAWLHDRAQSPERDQPWTVFSSVVCPHFPLTAPNAFYDMYAGKGLMPEKPLDDDEHPWLVALRTCFNYDNFTPEITNVALTAYYGLVTFMDDNVGQILRALEETGFAETTRVLYVSDHGDNAGERDLWGKSVLYEESAGIPTILAGPGVPEGRVCTTPVNLTDVFPTVLDNAQVVAEDGVVRPGRSLIELANEADDADRVVFSEYHAAGAVSGAYMIRQGPWKYVHYAGFEPQLFNLDDDPEERHDLGTVTKYADVRDNLRAELGSICDPDAINEQALSDCRDIVARHGGRDAVVAKGGFGATPPPGHSAEYATGET